MAVLDYDDFLTIRRAIISALQQTNGTTAGGNGGSGNGNTGSGAHGIYGRGATGSVSSGGARPYDDREEGGFVKKIDVIIEKIDGVIGTIRQAYSQFRDVVNPWAQADDAAAKYARAMGMNVEAMNSFRDATVENTRNNLLAAKYGVTNEGLMQMQQSYMSSTGRNIRMSNGDQENMAAISSVFGEQGISLAAQMENFGLTMSSSSEHMSKMYNEATKSGISLQKYSENVAKNMHLAQNYTFKNGIKGLESMAKKATAIKLDMGQIAAFADKVGSVEGSMDAAAKLQVLGGPFAQMADPMGMLNESLNDMEGLQDRVAKMVGGMGRFNKETGEVEVSSFDKRRIKEAAAAMGMDYSQLMQSVNRQAVTGEISKQLDASGNKNLSDEMKELIKNQGVIEKGKAGVSINGEFKSINELTNEDYEALRNESKSEAENIKDIAANVRSLVEIEGGMKKQHDAHKADMFSWAGKANKWGAQKVHDIGAIYAVSAGYDGTKGLWNAGKTLFGGLFGGGGGGAAGAAAGGAAAGGVAGGAAGAAGGAAGVAGGAAGGGVIGGGAGGGMSVGSFMRSPIGNIMIGGAGMFATQKMVNSGVIDAGSGTHKLLEATSRASLYGGIGSKFLGPIGKLVGGAVGLISGWHKASKDGVEKKINNQLKKKGITLNGDYSKRNLKGINEALATGKISDRLRKQLELNGDEDVLEQIEAKAKKKEREKKRIEQEKQEKRAATIKKIKSFFGIKDSEEEKDKNGKVKKKKIIDKAIFNVKEGYFSRIVAKGSKTKGGEKKSIFNKFFNSLFGKDEKNTVVSKVSSAQTSETSLKGTYESINLKENSKLDSSSLFDIGKEIRNAIIEGFTIVSKGDIVKKKNDSSVNINKGANDGVSNIQGKTEEGQGTFFKNTNNANSVQERINETPVKTTPTEINLNIKGEIKLTADDGKYLKINIAEYMKDERVKTEITKMIMEQISRIEKQSIVKERP